MEISTKRLLMIVLFLTFLSIIPVFAQGWNVELIATMDQCEEVRDVALQGEYAHITVFPLGLAVINVANPPMPIVAGFCAISSEPGSYFPVGVTVSGNYAYVAIGRSSYPYGGLKIINISDPSNPIEVGGRIIYEGANDVTISGNYAYVACNEIGLLVFDISNPVQPIEIGQCDIPGNAKSIALSEYYAFLACGDSAGPGTGGLRIINILNPEDPFEVGHYYRSGYGCDIAISGDYAFVAEGSPGLRVINVANPASPIEICCYNTPDWAGGVAISGNHAFVGDRASLRILNVSDLCSISEVGYYNTPAWATHLAVAEPYVYVAETSQFHEGCFQIFNCSQALGIENTSVPKLPLQMLLQPAYPNPFNPGTYLTFLLPRPSHVNLSIFDVTGRQVATMVNGCREAGNYQMVFNGSGLASGTYFCQLKVGDFTQVQKIVLVK